MKRPRKLLIAVNAAAFLAALGWLASQPSLETVVASLTLLATLTGLLIVRASAEHPSNRAGDASVSGDVSAGNGSRAIGGDARIEGGTGYGGASGGNVTLGPGTYSAGDGGSEGAGGNLIIKGGDAK